MRTDGDRDGPGVAGKSGLRIASPVPPPLPSTPRLCDSPLFIFWRAYE